MPWGDPTSTRRRIQADNSIPYSTGNATLSVQHVGMLKRLMFRLNAAYAYTKSTGPSVRDALGPWNIVSNLNVKVNAVGTFLDVSMWHLYLYNLVHYKNVNFDPGSSDNVNIQNTVAATDIFNNPAVPGATGPIAGVLGMLYFPLTIEVAGIREVGLWTLQNDEVNLQITPQWNPTPASVTALVGPYDIVGGDSFAVTTASTSLDIVREFYAVPKARSDYPIVGWFHQLVNQRTPMVTNITDVPIPKGGVVIRAIHQLVSAGTSLMTGANISRLSWLYGSNETPYDESYQDVEIRQRALYGHDLPTGVLTHDFWGIGGQTFRDCFDTNDYQNMRARITTPTAPAAGSYVDTLIERVIPIRGDAEKLW